MSLFNKKKDTDYAYAVARVRSNELSLLTEADTEQLIEAESYEAAMNKLADLGWGEVSKDTDYASYLEDYFAKHWAFLEEILDERLSTASTPSPRSMTPRRWSKPSKPKNGTNFQTSCRNLP